MCASYFMTMHWANVMIRKNNNQLNILGIVRSFKANFVRRQLRYNISNTTSRLCHVIGISQSYKTDTEAGRKLKVLLTFLR